MVGCFAFGLGFWLGLGLGLGLGFGFGCWLVLGVWRLALGGWGTFFRAWCLVGVCLACLLICGCDGRWFGGST